MKDVLISFQRCNLIFSPQTISGLDNRDAVGDTIENLKSSLYAQRIDISCNGKGLLLLVNSMVVGRGQAYLHDRAQGCEPPTASRALRKGV